MFLGMFNTDIIQIRPNNFISRSRYSDTLPASSCRRENACFHVIYVGSTRLQRRFIPSH